MRTYSDLSYSMQAHGFGEGITEFINSRIALAGQLISDPQVQTFGILAGFILLALIPVIGIPLALIGGGALVLWQTVNSFLQIDKALQLAPTRAAAMEHASSQNIRRTVAVNLTLLALVAIGAFKGIQEINRFQAFQESLSPWGQSALADLPLTRQVEIFNAARELNLAPNALEFYLSEVIRSGSPLAELPLTDALQVSSLAEQSGNSAFLMDYVARYGYTDALRLATPEVIKGMTSDQFLVQAQDILSKDAGYNITPEGVFTAYPASTIGKTVTFITNEVAITNIIGEFHGTKIIYITFDQAVALETALGLKPGTLVDGFRISKISDLNGLDVSYPLDGNKLFLGPGKGLPGGGTEMVINPSVPMDSPHVVDQIIIKVYP